MSSAITINLQTCKHVVLVGTDAPALGIDQIEHAIINLRNGPDVVITPAEDGGYVLIGMNQPHEAIFKSVPWATDKVLATTLENIHTLGLEVTELETCWDIDRPEDYERYLDMIG